MGRRKEKRNKVTLDVRRLFNRCVVWPQRRVNRVIRKYDEYLIDEVMRYREQEMQIRCVRRFRLEYPAYAWLLFHPKNEEAGGRTRAAIAKAEGVQAGVADLMFMIPNMDYHFLAIELKSKTGRQTPEQKLFQRHVTAAGGLYAVVRSDDDFWNVVSSYMENVGYTVRNRVEDLYEDVEAEKTAEARKVMERIIGKK